jgi:Ca-activated chloride channel homolog
MKNKGSGLGVWVILLLCAGSVWAGQVRLDVGLNRPVMMAGKEHIAYVRVGLTGLKFEKPAKRSSVNVVIVLDKSASMTGEKMRHAKNAALGAVDQLGPGDIVSVVTYDDTVNIVVPATKLSNKRAVKDAINRITAEGSTALFAGVSKGVAEVRKYASRNRVNRVILLSDGKANIGPSSPAILGELGSSLIKDGISITTIGLGLNYHEDLMAELARKSDGNHAFVKEAQDLVQVFKYEFGDLLSVVAQDVHVEIICPEGVRPMRIMGREGEILGQRASITLNQLYSGRMRDIILEVRVPAMIAGATRPVADVRITYVSMDTHDKVSLQRHVSARFTSSKKNAEKAVNRDVAVAVVEQRAYARNQLATSMADDGRIKEAQALLFYNYVTIERAALKYKAPHLNVWALSNLSQSKIIMKDYNRARKSMLQLQHIQQNAQSYNAEMLKP